MQLQDLQQEMCKTDTDDSLKHVACDSGILNMFVCKSRRYTCMYAARTLREC